MHLENAAAARTGNPTKSRGEELTEDKRQDLVLFEISFIADARRTRPKVEEET
jgi:hypothetical protein